MADLTPAGISRRLLEARARHRVPGMAVGVAQGGKQVAVVTAGTADVRTGREVDEHTQFRLGSVTKTFTAALVLRLAERGTLELDAPVESYLPGTPLGRPLLRQLLSHSGGVQREAPLPMWATMQGPDDEGLLASLQDARMVGAPAQRWHYSNLGYAILGQIVRVVTGRRCEDLIDEELIAPLGLGATTWLPRGDAATGYRLDPYTGEVHSEPVMQQGAIGVGGQLWSTSGDLLVWGHALLGGAPEVLPGTVVDTMHTPQVMVERGDWSKAWGHGLILDRTEVGILSGHTGAMPGFATALSLHRPTGSVVAALASLTRGMPLAGFAAELGGDVVAAAPQPDANRTDIGPCPPELAEALGRWWCEAEETVLQWRGGRLRAHLDSAPDASATTFERVSADTYVAVEGRWQGELLHVVRAAGAVSGLRWAEYPYTRTQR